MNMLNTIDRMESEIRGYVRSFPVVFESATKATLRTVDGREFIDFFAGAGTLNYGHNNEKANERMIEYIQKHGVQHGLDTATRAKIDFIETFESLILKPRNLDFKLQFTGPTGTNSVEAAIKLARKLKKRSHIIAFTNAYHGHSLGSLALTGNQYYHDEHYGSHDNVTHMPFDGYLGDDIDTSLLLEKMLLDGSSGLPKPAAIILETIQCEGGIKVASPQWLKRIEKICRDNDILLIIDDIQTGNGRTGEFFSFEASGIRPDLICLSKSIGGGLPMSLVLISRELDVWKPGQHTGTFRGNNLAFVASRACLENWKEADAFTKQTFAKGKLVQAAFQSIVDSNPTRNFSVRGRGMVWGIDLGNGELAGKVVQESFNNGLIIETAGADGHVVKFLAPLVIDESQLKDGLEILNRAFETQIGSGDASSQTTSQSSIMPQVGDNNPPSIGNFITE
jgi:diaminobutyrate-2-oxoglutarate transaminase